MGANKLQVPSSEIIDERKIHIFFYKSFDSMNILVGKCGWLILN